MGLMIEIEKKYRVLDFHHIKDFLKPMNYVSSGRIVDQYFDTVDGFYYQQGVFIRSRNNETLDVKFNPNHLKDKSNNDHVNCCEYSFDIPFHSSFEDLFESLRHFIDIKKPFPYSFQNFLIENHLISLVTIDKTRSSYENETCIIAVDDLYGFGTFIEFEAKDGTQNAQEFVQYVENLIQGLSLEPISSGYVEFALRETNESLYKKGKYLLNNPLKNEANLLFHQSSTS